MCSKNQENCKNYSCLINNNFKKYAKADETVKKICSQQTVSETKLFLPVLLHKSWQVVYFLLQGSHGGENVCHLAIQQTLQHQVNLGYRSS